MSDAVEQLLTLVDADQVDHEGAVISLTPVDGKPNVQLAGLSSVADRSLG